MAATVGTIASAITLVDLAGKTARFFYQTLSGYPEYESKIETIKGELESFKDAAMLLQEVISSRNIINDQGLSYILNQYRRTIVQVEQKIRSIYMETQNKMFGKTRGYVKLLLKDKELVAMRQRLRNHQHDMHFRCTLLVRDCITQVSTKLDDVGRKQSLHHRTSEASLKSLQDEFQGLKQNLNQWQQQQQPSFVGGFLQGLKQNLNQWMYGSKQQQPSFVGGRGSQQSLFPPPPPPPPPYAKDSMPYPSSAPVDPISFYGGTPCTGAPIWEDDAYRCFICNYAVLSYRQYQRRHKKK